MSPLQEIAQQPKELVYRDSIVAELGEKLATTIHVVRYDRAAVVPRVVRFEEATRLLDWCEDNMVAEALVGGFFMREPNQLLGETWLKGIRQPSVPFESPWDKVRGSIHIDAEGVLSIGLRNHLPAEPQNDLLQAGPVLVQNKQSMVVDNRETEGVSMGSRQFDTDITIGRYPRAAIGLNRDYIWSVVCDGRSETDAGLTLSELAEVMISLGADEALNLDGGGSASLVSGGILRNRPRGDGEEYPRGRPIFTAIVFE